MKCPACAVTRSKVTESKRCDGYVRRRRECLDCKHRWTTTEVSGQPLVVLSARLEMTADDLADALRARAILTRAACDYLGGDDEDPQLKMDNKSIGSGGTE